MLKLNINKTRNLNFEVQIGGINTDQLSGALKFKIDGIEYGFPVEIKSESIDVEIPPLRNILKREIKEGEKIKGSLELNGNGYFLNPWNDTFKIANPVTVEAKITLKDEEENSDTPSINIISEEKKTKNRKEIVQEKVNKKIEKMEVIKPKKSKKKELTLENMTKEHLFQFMESRGSRTKHIQELLYDNAVAQAQSAKPKDVFKVLVEILRKK